MLPITCHVLAARRLAHLATGMCEISFLVRLFSKVCSFHTKVVVQEVPLPVLLEILLMILLVLLATAILAALVVPLGAEAHATTRLVLVVIP
jgi:hypothetical protein